MNMNDHIVAGPEAGDAELESAPSGVDLRQRDIFGRRLRRRGLGAALVLGLFTGVTACGGLLDVTLPGSVQESDLDNPALAATMVNSALGQFECSYTNYIASVGILSSEYINASSWLNINGWGWRGIELERITGSCSSSRNSDALGAYSALQQARYLAEDGARRIEAFPDDAVPGKPEKLGMLAAYAGYSYVLLGEGYCEMAIDEGPIMTPDEVLAIAEQRFTSAIEYAKVAGKDTLELLALAGRARVRLDLGKLAEAADDADKIPAGFVWNAEYSTIDGRRENRLYNINHRNRFLSVDPSRYGNLELGGAPDPRVPVAASGLKGHDKETDHWYQNKYPEADTPIPMASWEEAQLIIAEARPAEAEAAINRLRASQNLPAYVPSGDHLADVLEARRRQLFSEGHRLNDMLRHDIPFPEGLNHKGQAYGNITCMPLPEQEKRANPKIGG